MSNFTPFLSLMGGLLIGAAAALLLVFNGRIAGISGIAGGLLARSGGHERQWRLAFLSGMVGAGVVASQVFPAAFIFELSRSWPAMAAAGLLVGIGTRVGNGCTSGHGVCGISRLSMRSVAATMAFMAAGMISVLIVSRVFGGAL